MSRKTIAIYNDYANLRTYNSKLLRYHYFIVLNVCNRLLFIRIDVEWNYFNIVLFFTQVMNKFNKLYFIKLSWVENNPDSKKEENHVLGQFTSQIYQQNQMISMPTFRRVLI